MSQLNAVLLVLPRVDHLAAYEPLLRELDRLTALTTVVVTEADPLDGLVRVRWIRERLYLHAGRGGRLSWLRFAVRRERVARRIVSRFTPGAMVVPSDVSDATLAFVAAARRRRVPVVYVQGTEVFPDYPARNAVMDSARLASRAWSERVVLRASAMLLRALGVHAKMGVVAVLGSQSDYVIVANERQRRILVSAGVSANRIFTMGAPFVDRLVAATRNFDAEAAVWRGRNLHAGDRPVALILTKNLGALGVASRHEHRVIVDRMIAAVREVIPDCQCVVKLHPAESEADYRWLSEDGSARVTVLSGGAAEDLLLTAIVTVSIGTSSPALAARFLGTRIVVLSLPGIEGLNTHLSLFDESEIARSLDALPEALRAALNGAPTADERRGSDRAAADGHASERIVEFLRRLVSQQVPAAHGV